MKALAAMLVLGATLAPTASAACGNLNALGRAREAARQARHLEGTRMVQGRWQLVRQEEHDSRSGSIHLRWGRHETGQTLDAHFVDELNCGFPLFPQDAAIGRFYLRRSGGSWRILHFDADGRQPEDARLVLEETTP